MDRQQLAGLSAEEQRALLAELLRKKTAQTKTAQLSFAQQRLWFVDQLEPGNVAYNMFRAMRLRGTLNVTALEQSFNQVLQRHESLRTTFAAKEGEPYQVIAPSRQEILPVVDISALSEAQRAVEAQRLAREEAQRPFDLARGPLVRCTLLRLAHDEHVLLLTMHHIVSDGWSLGILFREIVLLSQAYIDGKESPLPELPLQYADFAVWQREWLQDEVLETQMSYWRKQLAGAPAALELPADHPRPAIQNYHGARLGLVLSKELSIALQALSRQEDVTLFMTLLAAFQSLLSRYSGQTDIVVASSVAYRNRRELEELIGFFANTLVLRVDLSGNPGFHELLQRVRKTCLEAYAHQDVPFEKLVGELHVERDLSRNPLFQVMFLLQNAPLNIPDSLGLSVEPLEIDLGGTRFDLTLSLTETEQGLAGIIEYNTDLFESETIARMLAHFQMLLEGIVADPGARIQDLPMLSAAERHQILVEWNATTTKYPQDKCIHELFEEQVERTPDAVAVVFEKQQLTYQELNERANQLAHTLQKQGVGPDTLVGICVERSLEMIVGLLGILKAGGAYVPLDPDYPTERLAFMLEDTHTPVLLTQERLRNKLPADTTQVICLDTGWAQIERGSGTNPPLHSLPENLAYVIYTSGSTGTPKGAMNTHTAIRNRLLWMQAAYHLTDEDRVLQKTPFSFDVSVWEFFWPLMVGARLVMARPQGHGDPAYLVRTIVEQGITTIHFVPAMLQAFLNEPGLETCVCLKRVICSGEELSLNLQTRFFSKLGAQLHNLYGPTEAAVDVTHWACQSKAHFDFVPIGHPIANIQIFLLDAHLNPVPTGVPGELYIAGAGLARGYLHRADLTAEKFLPNPFSHAPGARMYRTGDLARWLPDGNLEYLGRIDHQVKLRGFRIELGEIEAVLSRHPAVQNCVVLAREDVPGNKQLVAYLQSPTQPPPPIADLRDFLMTRLPEYMLPSAFVFLAELPLTPNGKVDRKALPVPNMTRSEIGYVAPRTPTEETLAQIWAEVLHVERVGVQDNFFELGGHSLLVTQILSKIRTAFHIDLPLRSLFDATCIEAIASKIDKALQDLEEIEI